MCIIVTLTHQYSETMMAMVVSDLGKKSFEITHTKISYIISHGGNLWNWNIFTYEIFISHMK